MRAVTGQIAENASRLQALLQLLGSVAGSEERQAQRSASRAVREAGETRIGRGKMRAVVRGRSASAELIINNY